MTSIPPHERTRYLHQMSRIDGCPECITNYEAPRDICPTSGDGYTARYTCSTCSHTWATSWAA